MMRSQAYKKIECPNCSRRFCRKAAERHIPLCDKIFNKPKPLYRNREKQFLPSLQDSTLPEDEQSKLLILESLIILIKEKDARNNSVKPTSKIM